MRLKADKPRGVLFQGPPLGEVTHRRYHASPDLAFFIEHFWTVHWNLAGLPAKTVETLPHPSVHLVFEPGATLLGGVRKSKFARTLAGKSFVFAVKFRPASFHSFYGNDLSTLTNRTFYPSKLFGPEFHALEEQVLSAVSTEQRLALTEDFLRRRQPRESEPARLLNDLAARVAQDPSITRVEQLPSLCGASVRRLQRLFRRYIGVSPKWVIARYRIHEALERIHADKRENWATLAVDLGYSDQAHFIRDFKALVGLTPLAYQSRSLAE